MTMTVDTVDNSYAQALMYTSGANGTLFSSVRKHFLLYGGSDVSAHSGGVIVRDKSALEAELKEFNQFCYSGIFSPDQVTRLEQIRDRLFSASFENAG